ncbi:sulfotransferase [Gymnodinialimonas sp. 2305UL16-5]|uniref:sulfotransferase n=1 Tax=Gymnodinialimonas mytili TaxID=3126503 RepID=UPI0030B5B905
MQSREQIDDRLQRHPAIGSEPRLDGPRRIHPDRLKARGVKMEARVLLKSLIAPQNKPKPFVIYGRPRSGTTLLVRLLDQVPGLRCDGELLHYFLVSPLGFLARLPRRTEPDVRAYGVKLISYHLTEVQRIRRPLAFFDRLGALDYTVLHLTRSTWDQTLSLAKAQRSGVYFSKSNAGLGGLRIDPDYFLALLQWNEDILDYEREVMNHVDHLPLHYDDDLKNAAQHQATINRVCAHLGLPSAPVEAKMKRTGGKDGLQTVENLDELAAHVRQSPLAHLVPDTCA